VPDGFLKETYIDFDVINTVILVRLEDGADVEGFEAAVRAMSENVKAIYTLERGLESASGNIFLQGPIQVQRLGITFATLLSSLGVALVVSTTLGERQKEITLMAIRGFSFRQLFQMLIVENLGVISFSIILGAIVGYINVIGDVQLSNLSGALILRRVIFDQGSLTFIAAIVVVILLSAVIPIIVALRRSSARLSWRIIE
jgi:putative ABC transport system permease protein